LANLALVSALFLVIGNGLLNVSEKTLDSGLAALFVVTNPIWAALLAMGGRQGERLSPLGWAGLAISLAGVALLVRPFESGAPTSWLGIAAVLTAAFCWAVGGILSRRRLRGVDPFAASALEALFAGPCMLLIHLLLERGEPVVWNGQAWLAVGYLAGAGSIIGFTAFVYLTTHMTSSKVGTYTYVNPIVAILLGWLVLGEQITWRLAAGGGTILGGLLLLYFARVREGGGVVASVEA
ncbi:MAG: DMT family transporter, partial [Gemmatimonadota bacterium]